jgi:hypothetical protein
MKLTATRRFKYATRQLLPGDDFEAPNMVARALIGVKKAKAAGEPEAPPPPARPPPEPRDEERERLRDKAADLGIEVDGRWGVDRLREEIEIVVARSVPRYEEPEAEPEPAPEPEAKPE